MDEDDIRLPRLEDGHERAVVAGPITRNYADGLAIEVRGRMSSLWGGASEAEKGGRFVREGKDTDEPGGRGEEGERSLEEKVGNERKKEAK